MRKFNLSLLAGFLFLQFVSTAFATKVEIKFSLIKHSPVGAIEIRPGVAYTSDFVRQLLFFDRPIGLFQPETRLIYFPKDVNELRPFLAFKNKVGEERYWYCKQTALLKKPNSIAESHNRQIIVTVAKVPHQIRALQGKHQQIDCSYSWEVDPSFLHEINKGS